MTTHRTPQERRQMPRIRARHGTGQLEVEHAQMGQVIVDDDACTGCQLCVRVCPGQALEMSGPRAVRMVGDFAACIGCSDCVAICAPNAIRLARPLRYEGFYKTIGRGALAAPRCF